MKLTVPLARDVVMLGLGGAGMVHELFLVPLPNMVRVTVSLILLGGNAALHTYWLARNSAPVAPTPTASLPRPSDSSSSSPPSSPP